MYEKNASLEIQLSKVTGKNKELEMQVTHLLKQNQFYEEEITQLKEQICNMNLTEFELTPQKNIKKKRDLTF